MDKFEDGELEVEEEEIKMVSLFLWPMLLTFVQ